MYNPCSGPCGPARLDLGALPLGRERGRGAGDRRAPSRAHGARVQGLPLGLERVPRRTGELDARAGPPKQEAARIHACEWLCSGWDVLAAAELSHFVCRDLA